MDSITHIALGACIGEASISKQAGKKALLLGAIAQNLPDIDVVASLWLPSTENLLFHRGFTHSFLFGAVAACLLSVILRKIFGFRNVSFVKLSVFFCLQMWLHDLLDTCNAYGTGLFEPFSHQRFSFHLLYVADPFFSISLVIAFFALVILKKHSPARKRWLIAGLIPASFYLLYSIYNKASINRQVEKSLLITHVPYKTAIITPTPFNSFLWYIVAAADSGYFVGYRSIFDKDSLLVPFTYYPKNEQFLQSADKNVNVKQLLRFADHYYTVQYIHDSVLVFNVLRFGQVLGWQNAKADFAFQYFLSSSYDNSLVVQRGRFRGWNRKTLTRMYKRIMGN